MHYLECISMLNYLLKKLNSGQRTQVPVEICQEVQSVLLQVKKKLEKEPTGTVTLLLNSINDTFMAAEAATKSNVLYLSDSMKNAIVSGVSSVKFEICLYAFQYFKTHEFEPTSAIIPTMRDVVSAALAKGVI